MIEISKTIIATSAAKTTMSLVLRCINSWGSTPPVVFQAIRPTYDSTRSWEQQLRIKDWYEPHRNLKYFLSLSLV